MFLLGGEERHFDVLRFDYRTIPNDCRTVRRLEVKSANPACRGIRTLSLRIDDRDRRGRRPVQQENGSVPEHTTLCIVRHGTARSGLFPDTVVVESNTTIVGWDEWLMWT